MPFCGTLRNASGRTSLLRDLVGLGPGDVAEIAPDPSELKEERSEYLLALKASRVPAPVYSQPPSNR